MSQLLSISILIHLDQDWIWTFLLFSRSSFVLGEINASSQLRLQPFLTLSQSMANLMEPSLNHSISAELGDQNNPSHGGEVETRHLAGQQHSNYTLRKKSNLRLNDQLIPKPTDINMGERVIKIAVPKEHPYSSHISRFAMFPSYHSPDDPDTGVRAASQPFLSPLVPNSAPDVTLLNKTIGGPYRREVLETPVRTQKKAVTFSGEHGFLDYPKPLKGESQVFYPTPTKAVMPNLKLRGWDLSLPERTSNMLKNLERTHWLTSYQMDYTGSGPANPLKIDDFMEKLSNLAGMNSNTTLLRERSYPVFVPSKPREGCKRRKETGSGRISFSPTGAADLPNPFPAPHRASASATPPGPHESTATDNEASDPNQKGHSQSQYSTEAGSAELSHRVLHKQRTGTLKENCKAQFDESLTQTYVSQSSKEANAAQTASTEQPLHRPPLLQAEKDLHRENSLNRLCNKDARNGTKECSKAATNSTNINLEKLTESRELPWSMLNPCILPRPPVLPDIGTMRGQGAAPGLLDLQDAFSKTDAHHNFNNSIKRAAVNLRDNVVTGKKHDFYGINCWYLHG
ncbi:uncharacterized protein C7orf31 homolog [Sphaeramia orbicularis]|uniref:uncharacterized protein C7orf31 homolog n=1 Tax=Sphaeramia orbicularis TaxID=375764 RepID=UPI00118061A9|nr:uncharacterized protein C7orf31 homolog [Sphaeramia orbicularis]